MPAIPLGLPIPRGDPMFESEKKPLPKIPGKKLPIPRGERMGLLQRKPLPEIPSFNREPTQEELNEIFGILPEEEYFPTEPPYAGPPPFERRGDKFVRSKNIFEDASKTINKISNQGPIATIRRVVSGNLTSSSLKPIGTSDLRSPRVVSERSSDIDIGGNPYFASLRREQRELESISEVMPFGIKKKTTPPYLIRAIMGSPREGMWDQ